MILTSPRLVEQAASDPAAFAELYEACFPAVFHYLQFRCDGTQAAQDLTAQVFEKVLQKHDLYRPGTNFRAWLFEVARNQALTALRTRQRLPRPISTLQPVPQ